MQKLEKYKKQKLSNFSQLIILNDQGSIIESCDSIFETEDYKNQPFTHYFPFLESILDILLQLKVNGDEMKYSKIESPLIELPGVYDFTFSRVILDGAEYILWSIFDYTELYEDFKQYQQKRNELEIHREVLESRNRNLHHQKDLLAQKNIALQNWDQVRKDYYNKVRMALESPVNALDGLSFILANVTKETDKDYISALRAAVRHLQDVLSEFQIVSTIDGDKQSSEIKAFDPVQVIESTSKKLYNTIDSSDFKLNLTLAPGLPNRLLGNPNHLHQILFQLLVNVQKYNTACDLDLDISSQKGNSGNWNIRIEIKENLENKRECSKSDKHSESDATELIFRLSLVKKLIELEGGRISVENQVDNGGFFIQAQLSYPEVA